MKLALLLAALLSAQQPKSIKLVVYDNQGKPLDLHSFLAHIGRADIGQPPDPAAAPISVTSPEGQGAPARPVLREENGLILLSWTRLSTIQLSLPWPVDEDGYSTVWADKEKLGYADGAVVMLNEEIAATQYRLFRDSTRKHQTEMQPLYKQGAKAKKAAEEAKLAMAAAHGEKAPDKRAVAFAKAMRATSIAWQKMLFEHALQIALSSKGKEELRFGLTLDEGLLNRLNHFRWLSSSIQRSGTNWVRLVFKANPDDFTYSSLRSFNEYDEIIDELREKGLRIMGTVLDTAQWPRGMKPAQYSERVKNLALHYKDKIRSWEVGTEINGDWLGGSRDPMGPDEVYRIYRAGASKLKELDPTFESVVTLYWWDGTAPTYEHSTFGWLKRRVREGFGRDVDVIGLSLQADDNPVGMALETIFERVHQELPDKRLMISSLGYVEGQALKGYWWFDPEDVVSGRSDVLIFMTTASCALPRSLCGGFWWQALDQMIPGNRKTTGLFSDLEKTLEQLGR